MKCKYTHFKSGGEVDKEVAIKIGGSYYHKECYEKVEIKRSVSESLIGMGFIVKQVNMVVKKHIDDESIPPKYILWMINKIKAEELTLNNPYGLGYYLKEGRNWKEFSKKNAIEECNKLKKENIFVETVESPTITWKQKGTSYGKIL